MKKLITTIASALFLTGVVLPAQDMPEIRNSVTWDRLNANPAQLPQLGRIVPVKSDINKESWWSVGSETLDRDYSDFEEYKNFMGFTGVGYARLQSGWAKCEPQMGKYNFEWLDKHVDGLIAQGIKPWICLCYGNPVYSDAYGDNLGASIFGEGPIMEGWERYVGEVVKRYKGKVTMYEVWNEPDGNKPEVYATLFQHTSNVIRKYDKDVKICALALCGPNSGYACKAVERMKELDCIDNVDYITYHAYYPVPETVIPEALKMREDVKKAAGREIPFLQGETGCPGQLEYGHAMHSIEWNEYSQSKWDLRQMLSQFAIGVPYSVFTMVDLNYGWMQQSYGLIRMNLYNKPQYLRPKFHAVQNVTSIFTYDVKSAGFFNVESKASRNITCFGLKKGGKVIGFALWFIGERPTDSLEREPVNLTVDCPALSDPVYVDMITGTVYDIGGCIRSAGKGNKIKISKLPVWDSPMVVINRDEINFE